MRLESGGRLTRCEFERRYAARPDIRKAELIEGVAYVASPARATSHGGPQAAVQVLLGTYAAFTPGTLHLDNATVRLDLDNEFQPDDALLVKSESGGQSRISDDDCIEGAPELVVDRDRRGCRRHCEAEICLSPSGRQHGGREGGAWPRGSALPAIPDLSGDVRLRARGRRTCDGTAEGAIDIALSPDPDLFASRGPSITALVVMKGSVPRPSSANGAVVRIMIAFRPPLREFLTAYRSSALT